MKENKIAGYLPYSCEMFVTIHAIDKYEEQHKMAEQTRLIYLALIKFLGLKGSIRDLWVILKKYCNKGPSGFI